MWGRGVVIGQIMVDMFVKVLRSVIGDAGKLVFPEPALTHHGALAQQAVVGEQRPVTAVL